MMSQPHTLVSGTFTPDWAVGNEGEEREAIDESAALSAARLGDPDAFAALFRRYRSRLFVVARRYFVPGGNEDIRSKRRQLVFLRRFETSKVAAALLVLSLISAFAGRLLHSSRRRHAKST